MKYSQVPTPIRIIGRTFDPSTGIAADMNGELVTLDSYSSNFWLNSTRWETPKANLARLVKVVAELRRAPLEWMAFEDADWAILTDIIKNPDTTVGQPRPVAPPPLIAIQLTAFDDAILNATDARPEGV